LEEDREAIQREVEQSRRQMEEFRISKLCSTLEGVTQRNLRRNRRQAFLQVQSFTTDLAMKERKMLIQQRYRSKALFFGLWHREYRKQENQR